jgi:hypothetical protein
MERIKVFRIANPVRRATGIRAGIIWHNDVSDAMANVWCGIWFAKGDSLVALATAFRHFWETASRRIRTVTISRQHCRGDDAAISMRYDTMEESIVRWRIEMAVETCPVGR